MITTDLKLENVFIKDILQLDLSMIKLKLQDKEEGQGWSTEFCEQAELEYKRFLAMKRHFPNIEIVPNKVVDVFWHQHILDTVKYCDDCQELFGYFVHHFPYFGMGGKEDYQNLCDAFEKTKSIYQNMFGQPYTTIENENGSNMARCRTACKPVKCK